MFGTNSLNVTNSMLRTYDVHFRWRPARRFEVHMHHYPRETQKSHVPPMAQAHEHLFLARIPYQKVSKNIASKGKFRDI